MPAGFPPKSRRISTMDHSLHQICASSPAVDGGGAHSRATVRRTDRTRVQSKSKSAVAVPICARGVPHRARADRARVRLPVEALQAHGGPPRLTGQTRAQGGQIPRRYRNKPAESGRARPKPLVVVKIHQIKGVRCAALVRCDRRLLTLRHVCVGTIRLIASGQQQMKIYLSSGDATWKTCPQSCSMRCTANSK